MDKPWDVVGQEGEGRGLWHHVPSSASCCVLWARKLPLSQGTLMYRELIPGARLDNHLSALSLKQAQLENGSSQCGCRGTRGRHPL